MCEALQSHPALQVQREKLRHRDAKPPPTASIKEAALLHSPGMDFMPATGPIDGCATACLQGARGSARVGSEEACRLPGHAGRLVGTAPRRKGPAGGGCLPPQGGGLSPGHRASASLVQGKSLVGKSVLSDPRQQGRDPHGKDRAMGGELPERVPGIGRVLVLAGGGPGWCPPACTLFYGPDRRGRGSGGERQRMAEACCGGVALMSGFSVGVWLVTFERMDSEVTAVYRGPVQRLPPIKCQAPTAARKQEGCPC